MRRVESTCSRHLARLGAVALVAASLAACSSDTDRFSDNPFASRKPVAQREATGSVAAAPVGRVESRPLQSSQLPPPVSRPATVASSSSYSTGVAGGGAGMYQPPRTAHEVTGTVRPAPVAPQPQPQTQYDWNGGTPVTVARGETIESISLRYSVPSEPLMRANGLQPHSVLREGQRLVIPRRVAVSQPAQIAPAPVMSAPAVAAPAVTRPAIAAKGGFVHVVGPGESLLGIAKKYRKGVREIADANKLRYDQPVRIGDRLTIPGIAPVASAPQPMMQQQSTVSNRFPQQPVQQPQQTASNENQSKIHVATPANEVEKEATSSTGGAPQFRWPVRGRVISGFGPMTNGQQNDGVNLSVPEGTSVRAAEDGTVAYAGNELKGYGNLLLVRHNNGYVTAYAHTSELMVKRGDAVRRGQIIAKSGATGTVTSPQLHFEIRKGSVPVDPMTYLPGA